MFSRMPRAFSRARLRHVSRLLLLSPSKVMYCAIRGPRSRAGPSPVVAGSVPMIVNTLCHCQLTTGNWQLFFSRLLFLQHPRILAAASLGAVNDQASFAEGDAGEPAGHDDYFFAVEDVGAEVDAAALETVINKAGMLA